MLQRLFRIRGRHPCAVCPRDRRRAALRQTLRISGLRVFGNGDGACPAQANAKAVRVDALDGKISWQHVENAQGCNVRYGIAPDKLYQSWLVYDADEVTLSTLMAGQTYYVCVDSFNENGITTGKVLPMKG